MRSLFVAAILLPLSGCIVIDGGPYHHDPCAQWHRENYVVTAHDPGLFAAVQNATPANWTRGASTSGGLLPDNQTLDDVWGGYALWGVAGPDTGLPQPQGWPLRGEPPGHVFIDLGSEKSWVTLVLADGVSDAAVVPWAEQFLENITTMDVQARHDWAARFSAKNERLMWGNLGEFHGRKLHLDERVELIGLWDRIRPQPDTEGNARAAGWTFMFSMKPIAITHGAQQIEIARDDTITFRGDWQCGMVLAKDPREGWTILNSTRPMADFNAAYATLDRPPPDDAEFRYVGPVV